MGHLFRRAVSRFPSRTAVVDPDGGVDYTYGEWSSKVDTVAGALAASGLDAGDTVSVIMENRVELLTVYWATQQLGAVFVPLNFRASADEVSFLVDNVSADLLFFSHVSRDAVLSGRSAFETPLDVVYVDSDVPDEAISYDAFCEEATEPFEPTVVDSSETSLVLHTSGTTGKPKGVSISHAANYARTLSNPIHLDWEQGETTLGIMPNFHEMGRAAISSTVLLNGTYVAQRSWSPEQGLDLIDEYGIDILYLVPTMFHDMVDYEGVDEYDLSSVNKIGYAGTAMSERVHREIVEIFDPDNFTNFYGASEMNCMTTCPWVADKPGCAGRAGINTAVRVVTPVEGETVSPDEVVPAGELGEIILDASSEEAFDGYLNRPEATEQAFEDGWYFTGDLGYKDEADDVWVVGRVDDMLISGGENIYPIEIEDVLDEHELVGDVAVGCISDDRFGQLVTAYVRANDTSLSWDEIAERLDTHCVESDGLADFKRPRVYVFVTEVPKSDVGKKLRRKLRVDDIDGLTDVEILAKIRL